MKLFKKRISVDRFFKTCLAHMSWQNTIHNTVANKEGSRNHSDSLYNGYKLMENTRHKSCIR